MKYFFLIICSIIFPILSLKKTIPKLCINCNFFTNSVSNDNTHGKCVLFPQEENNVNFLVSGTEYNDYYYCTTARTYEHLCGKEGKKYKRKYLKKQNK